MRNKKPRALLLAALAFCLLLSGCAPRGGQGVRPGYTREEPGHWTRTQVMYIDPLPAETAAADGLTVAVGRTGEGYPSFTFDGPGGQTGFTVEAFGFGDRYFASEAISPGVNVIRQAEGELLGDVVCTLAFAELHPQEDEAPPEVVIVDPFTARRDGTPVERFSVGEHMTQATGYDGTKYYIELSGALPEGKTDGEKLYAALSAQDGEGLITVWTVWEYTWAAEPETVEVPDEYGPIEYHLTGLAVLVPIAAVIAAVAAIIAAALVRRKKRKR